MSKRVNSFSDARKRPAKGRSVDVIDLKPLAMVEPKKKGTLNPLKRIAEFSTPVGENLMADAMRGTRTSRTLTGLQVHTAGGTQG